MEQLSLDIGIELEDSLSRQTDSRRRWARKYAEPQESEEENDREPEKAN